jgi:DNA (cytosine-5)-methyltransferase 1
VQRTDDLFGEYCRMIEGLRPAVFTAENVSGLVKGVAKGYFKEILARMKAAGYQVQARLLDASWLGVPQARQRIFFVGVREDLGMAPAYPKPLPYRYSVRDALPHILAQGANTEFGQAAWEDGSRPSGSLGADPSTGNGLSPPGHVLEVAEIITQRGPKEEPQYSAGDITDRPAPAVLERNGNYQVAGPTGVTHDPETGADITIGRYAIGKEWLRLAEGQKSGRYQQLWRPDDGRPVPTLTARAGAEGVAGVMHWAECRKLTLGELRALCGFPPDFVLTGSYKQRWERLGRAVPPVMMAHLAAAIRDQILVPLRADGRIG